jgi:hypothetical protein
VPPTLPRAFRVGEDGAPKLFRASRFDVQGATFTIVALTDSAESDGTCSATMVKVAPVSSKQRVLLMGMLEFSSGSWDPTIEERHPS